MVMYNLFGLSDNMKICFFNFPNRACVTCEFITQRQKTVV